MSFDNVGAGYQPVPMPRRELCHPGQVIAWLDDWGRRLPQPAEMILIGSAALLWHVAQAGLDASMPENSMDADPVTSDDAVAELAYEAMIGSEFERIHGWHVNLMPDLVLRALPEGWKDRCAVSRHGNLTVIVPEVSDLLAPKLMRNEPRDRAHAAWMTSLGLYQAPE